MPEAPNPKPKPEIEIVVWSSFRVASASEARSPRARLATSSIREESRGGFVGQ